MTSMISYFGQVEIDEEEQQPSSDPRWDGAKDLGANLSKLCPECQLKILLDQSLAAAYYLKIYGPRCHEVINDYIEELNTDICYRFARMCGKSFQDNFVKIYNMLMGLVKFNRGGNWSDVDISLIDEFLFDGNKRCGEPVVFCKCRRSALITWLMWMNKSVQNNYSEFAAEKCGVISFYLDSYVYSSHDTGFMSVETRFNEIGQSFSCEQTPLDELKSCALLGYLSHFNWSRTSFETCVGIITNFCMHTDIERQGLTLNHHLAYCLKQGVLFPRFNLAGNNIGIDPIMSKYHSELFNALLAFVKFCTTTRGMTMVDKNIVAKAFGCFAFTKEQKDSVAYLQKSDAVPSADEYKSFKKVMGSIESLQLISQSPSLYSAQADVEVTGSTEAKTEDGDGEDKTDQKDNDKKDQTAEEKKDDTKSDDKEGDDNKEDDDSEPTDDDDGADDFSEDDTSGDELSEFDAGDVSGEGSGGSSDPGASNDNTPSTENGGTPDDINTADEKGIDFVITPPEMATVDSVLFREEMYKFLSNVLTNPPKCMSPQDIATLTILKRCWLSCLSIETIKGIVEACIRLPLSIKHSLHKSTELNK